MCLRCSALRARLQRRHYDRCRENADRRHGGCSGAASSRAARGRRRFDIAAVERFFDFALVNLTFFFFFLFLFFFFCPTLGRPNRSESRATSGYFAGHVEHRTFGRGGRVCELVLYLHAGRVLATAIASSFPWYWSGGSVDLTRSCPPEDSRMESAGRTGDRARGQSPRHSFEGPKRRARSLGL